MTMTVEGHSDTDGFLQNTKDSLKIKRVNEVPRMIKLYIKDCETHYRGEGFLFLRKSNKTQKELIYLFIF